jgi:hypothetical protein
LYAETTLTQPSYESYYKINYQNDYTIKMQKLLGFLMLIALIYCRPAHSQNDINHYISLNEKETRLQAFKDSKEIIALKLKQVDYINKSRKRTQSTCGGAGHSGQ